MQPHTCSFTETTMENHRKKSSSGEIFSFPSTPNREQDSEFEFGCWTPDSQAQDPSRSSPADHLFFNGKLLPHSFPCQQPPTAASIIDNIYRATSRNSSISSKDSLMSSRSNSTSSRSSNCSSARTSSTDNSERKLLYYNKAAYNTITATTASKLVTAQLYGSSQRWQYLTPVPALKHDVSQRKHGGIVLKEELRSKRQGEKKKKKDERTTGICRRFFMSFLFACRECHAMEPGNMKL